LRQPPARCPPTRPAMAHSDGDDRDCRIEADYPLLRARRTHCRGSDSPSLSTYYQVSPDRIGLASVDMADSTICFRPKGASERNRLDLRLSIGRERSRGTTFAFLRDWTLQRQETACATSCRSRRFGFMAARMTAGRCAGATSRNDNGDPRPHSERMGTPDGVCGGRSLA
jgi:hypothetical protein